MDDPGGTGPLRVTLRVEGARVVVSGTRARFHLPGGTSLRYDRLVAIDAVGRDLPATLEAVGEGVQIVVEVAGAVWSIEVDPTLSTGWHAFGDLTNDEYGTAMAIAGDVDGDSFDDLLIGAKAYDDGQTDEGVAWVFYGSNAGLSSTPDWTYGSDQASAAFGATVSAAGDVDGDRYDDIVVGTSAYDGANNANGQAWIFHGDVDGLDAEATTTSTDDRTGPEVAEIVSGGGDVDGDGYDDVLVGTRDWYGHAWILDGGRWGASWSVPRDRLREPLGVRRRPRWRRGRAGRRLRRPGSEGQRGLWRAGRGGAGLRLYRCVGWGRAPSPFAADVAEAPLTRVLSGSSRLSCGPCVSPSSRSRCSWPALRSARPRPSMR